MWRSSSLYFSCENDEKSVSVPRNLLLSVQSAHTTTGAQQPRCVWEPIQAGNLRWVAYKLATCIVCQRRPVVQRALVYVPKCPPFVDSDWFQCVCSCSPNVYSSHNTRRVISLTRCARLTASELTRRSETIVCSESRVLVSFFPQRRQRTCSLWEPKLWWADSGPERRSPRTRRQQDQLRHLHVTRPCWEDRHWSDTMGDWRGSTLQQVRVRQVERIHTVWAKCIHSSGHGNTGQQHERKVLMSETRTLS